MLILLLLALVLPSPASAETLNFQVTDTLSIRAEAPDAPEALPSIVAKPHEFDVEKLRTLLMQGEAVWEESGDQITLWEPDDAAILILHRDRGRFTYQTAYYGLYMSELLGYVASATAFQGFPAELELPGLPRADAVARARAMLEAAGVRLLPSETVRAIDRDSVAALKALLAESELQVSLSKRYLEPFDLAHEGYLMTFDLALAGLRCDAAGAAGQVKVLLTRQGFEWVSCGNAADEVSREEPQKLMSAADALRQAAKSLEQVDADRPRTVTSIRLVYAPQSEVDARKSPGSSPMIPAWRFVCAPGGAASGGGLFEPEAPFVTTIVVDARTGALITRYG